MERGPVGSRRAIELAVLDDVAAVARAAAAAICDWAAHHPGGVLGLATGATMVPVYRELARRDSRGHDGFRRVTAVNLDEYVGLGPGDPESFHHFMQRHLFGQVPFAARYIPNGVARDLDEECRRYDALLDHLGGVGLQVLGLGTNGHVGFNEPGTPWEARTHVAELSATTRAVNAATFGVGQHVPAAAITMGIRDIRRAQRLLMVAVGPHKAEALGNLLQEESSPHFPATALLDHQPPMQVLVDRAAARELSDW